MGSNQKSESKEIEITKPLLLAIVSDFIGLTLVGLGASAYFSKIHMIPQSMRFVGYDVFFMVFGGLIAVASFVYIVSQVRK